MNRQRFGKVNKMLAQMPPWRYLLMFSLLLFLLTMLELPDVYGFVLFPDEFGYWTPAAALLGYDWTGAVSVGHYYSYGYALLLLPLLMVIDEPVLRYRVACVFNMLMTVFMLLMLYRLLCLIEPRGNRRWYAILSGLAVLYPAWIYYSQMTLAEILIVTVYLALLVCLAAFLQSSGRKRMIWAVGLLFSSAYLYAVHRRTIGIVLACPAALLFSLLCERKARVAEKERKNGDHGTGSREKYRAAAVCIALFAAALLFLFLISHFRQRLIDSAYTGVSKEMLAISSYSRQFEVFRQIFTLSGGKLFAESLCGKLLYLSAATYGLFWWGMARAWRYVRKGGRMAPFYLFVFLATIANVLISAVFMLEPLRYDTLVYGRYNETMTPVLLVLGILEILHEKRRGVFVRKTATLFLVLGFVTAVCLQAAAEYGWKSMHGQLTPGISYWIHDEVTGSIDDMERFLLQVLLYAVLMSIFVAVLIRLIRKRPQMPQIALALMAVQIALGAQLQTHYTDTYNRFNVQDHRITQKLRELGADAEAGVLYVYPSGAGTPFIDLIQYQMKEIPIRVSTEMTDAAGLPYVIVDRSDPRRNEDPMLSDYGEELETAHFCLYYARTDEKDRSYGEGDA